MLRNKMLRGTFVQVSNVADGPLLNTEIIVAKCDGKNWDHP